MAQAYLGPKNMLGDNTAFGFGAARDGKVQWDTTDANANALTIDLPTGGAVNVPALVIGIGVHGVDLGMFNGLTQTFVGVVDADRDSYAGLFFSADDTPVIRMRVGAAGTVRNHTLPDVASDTLALLDATQTLTAKTLTAPDINGGTADALTSLGIRSTGAAFDLTLATATVFTAGRTLTIDPGDAARTLTLTGNATLNQDVSTTGSPTFADLIITSFAANWTNAGRTVADLGIVTTVDINGGTIGGVTVDGTLTFNEPIVYDLVAAITASVTQTQGQGALTAEINEVATVANLDDTVTLPSAVAGVRCVIVNNGANILQVFPASGDNLGAGVNTAGRIGIGQAVAFHAIDTTNWELTTVRPSVDIQAFTATGTWYKLLGAVSVEVLVRGAGGGGGGGAGAAAGNLRRPGTGGGGGAFNRAIYDAADLGATEAVTIGAGGTSGAGGSSADGTSGGAGGSTDFGSRAFAYGGGGGKGGEAANTASGGGGGGIGSAGAVGALGAASLGGQPRPNNTAGSQASGFEGAGGLETADGNFAAYGGASAGGIASASVIGRIGGSSLHGGAGGGAAGGVSAADVAAAGAAGGNVNTITVGGGGAGGAATGAAGTAGTAGDTTKGGTGGGGGGGNTGGTGGAGGNGGAGGGGAGGGGGGTTVGGAGGVGGAGRCWAITRF